MFRFALTVLAVVCCLSPFKAVTADELTFGSSAPEFKVGKFLRGAPIQGPGQGKVRVVEFSGTECLPCIKLIPEMNKLQESHPDVEFVCLFQEKEEKVRQFLEGRGKRMAIRVALDTSRQMQKHWANAAEANGIPLVFVVDKAGKIAWIGYPGSGELPAVLQRVIAGTNDVRLERIRWELDRALEKRQEESVDAFNAASIKAGRFKTPAEAIAFIDETLPTFVGMPEFIGLQGLKLTYLQKLPNSRQQAYDHAMTLAVAARQEKNPFHYDSTCLEMLGHYDNALPENKDERLVDLALLLLQDESVRSNQLKLGADQAIDWQIQHSEILAYAHRLRGNLPLAIETLKQALEQARSRDSKGKPDWWLKEKQRVRKELEEKLQKLKTQTAEK